MAVVNLRVSVVIDGVTLPDQYFTHPNFSGSTASVTAYAQHSPADGTTDKYATSSTGALSKSANTYSPNDSNNTTNDPAY